MGTLSDEGEPRLTLSGARPKMNTRGGMKLVQRGIGANMIRDMKVVGASGLEPPASESRTLRANQLRHAPPYYAVMSMSASRTLRANRLRYAPPAIIIACLTATCKLSVEVAK